MGASAPQIVLAFADELAAKPKMLEAWVASASDTDLFRLRIVFREGHADAPELTLRCQLPATLSPRVPIEFSQDRMGVASRVPADAIARYSEASCTGPLGALPRYAPWEIGLLRGYSRCLERADNSSDRGGPPAWLGVGVQKAGTTWWAQLLAEHPGIWLPVKELHYFDGMRDRRPSRAAFATYHRLFAAPPGTLPGEFTPSYVFRHWVPPLLAAVAPEARVLVILRDPVERYRSGMAHDETLGRPPDQECHREHLERGLYGRQLELLFRSFPREHVLVLQYEQVVDSPEAAYRKTLEFLGARDRDFLPPSIGRRIHESRRPKAAVALETLNTLVEHYQQDAEWLASHVPELDLDLWCTTSSGPRASHTQVPT